MLVHVETNDGLSADLIREVVVKYVQKDPNLDSSLDYISDLIVASTAQEAISFVNLMDDCGLFTLDNDASSSTAKAIHYPVNRNGEIRSTICIDKQTAYDLIENLTNQDSSCFASVAHEMQHSKELQKKYNSWEDFKNYQIHLSKYPNKAMDIANNMWSEYYAERQTASYHTGQYTKDKMYSLNISFNLLETEIRSNIENINQQQMNNASFVTNKNDCMNIVNYALHSFDLYTYFLAQASGRRDGFILKNINTKLDIHDQIMRDIERTQEIYNNIFNQQDNLRDPNVFVDAIDFNDSLSRRWGFRIISGKERCIEFVKSGIVCDISDILGLPYPFHKI